MKIVEYLGSEFCLNDQIPARFVFGVWKCGSTLLNEAVRYCAQRNQGNWVSIPDQLFQDNVDLIGDYGGIVPAKLIKPNNVYGGFRCFPRSLSASRHFVEGPKILMVRDPRDALVSQYYSYAGSHQIPAGDNSSGPRARLLARRDEISRMSLDDFVIEDSRSQSAYSIREGLESYRSLLQDEKLLVIKYEDIILKKNNLLTLICDHFEWNISEQDRRDILFHIDIQPEKEDSSRFIRKVVPGDHIEKLHPETIARLNVNLRPVLDLFGYPENAQRIPMPPPTEAPPRATAKRERAPTGSRRTAAKRKPR